MLRFTADEYQGFAERNRELAAEVERIDPLGASQLLVEARIAERYARKLTDEAARRRRRARKIAERRRAWGE